MLASTDDVLWVNLKTKNEIDVDDTFLLGDIKSIVFKNQSFFIMANKYKGKLGYFLLEMKEDLYDAQQRGEEPRYVLKWENKLEIGDANIEFFSKQGEDESDVLAISYKEIHKNVYTVFLVHYTTGRLIYKHENYQLWESPVVGFVNSFQNDFVIMNKDGTSFIPLSTNE